MKTSLHSLMVASIAAALQSSAPNLHAEVRTFTSTAGTSIQGELVSVNGDMVTIKKADGQSFTIKATNFSAADQAYLKAHGLKDAGASADLASATKDKPFTNSLGMQFVAISETKVLFCTTLTTVENYLVYAEDIHVSDDQKKKMYEEQGGKERKKNWPVILSWDDAKAFSVWLSKKEGRNYRFPTDREWSLAVGIGKLEDEKATPESLSEQIKDVYPWGTQWPPPPRAANLADESLKLAILRTKGNPKTTIDGYNDHYPLYSPVTAFKPDKQGLHDMAGNSDQWCEDWYDAAKTKHLTRGSSMLTSSQQSTLSSSRKTPGKPEWAFTGCRLVVEVPEP